MINFAILRVALRALQRNLLRTLLTMLGIIIGVAAVIAMEGIGNGAKAQIEAQIATLGQNVVLVMSGNVTRGGVFSGFGAAGTLTLADAEAIRHDVEGLVALSPEVRGTAQLATAGGNWNTQILGESEDYLTLREWPVAEGDNFSADDVRSLNRVVLLGQSTAAQLFPDGASPVGQTIRIRNVPFTVVGLLARKGSNMMGQDQDDVAIIPYSTAMRRLFGQQTNLRAINVSAENAAAIPGVSAQITDLLRQRHNITGDKDDDFIIRTQDEIAEAATATSRVMTALLASIASVSLLVGGIGIMNIMLVSVTERTREIGTRLAVGARRRDVLLQFLTEAVVLSGTGGATGLIIGYAASALLASRLHWPALQSPSAAVIAILFSAAIGVFFGYYPARKASRLDPIVALRFE